MPGASCHRRLSRLGFTAAPAKPGFINIRLAPEVWHAQLRAILRAGTAFGDSAIGGGERVNVEFVSANPTGPMHVGHGRGAVVGDALAGPARQGRVQAYSANITSTMPAPRSISSRARPICDTARRWARRSGRFPKGFYPGEYLVETGRALAERDGRKWLGRPEAEWLAPVRDFAVEQMMALIRADLAALGVDHDLFVSERELVESGRDRRMPRRSGASAG